MLDLFPGKTFAFDVQKAIEAHWDMRGPLPVPSQSWNLKCPCCDANRQQGAIQVRGWQFFMRLHTGSKMPYRCDVGFKCRACSHAFGFGILLNHEDFKRMAPPWGGRVIEWREGQQALTVWASLDSYEKKPVNNPEANKFFTAGNDWLQRPEIPPAQPYGDPSAKGTTPGLRGTSPVPWKTKDFVKEQEQIKDKLSNDAKPEANRIRFAE